MTSGSIARCTNLPIPGGQVAEPDVAAMAPSRAWWLSAPRWGSPGDSRRRWRAGGRAGGAARGRRDGVRHALRACLLSGPRPDGTRPTGPRHREVVRRQRLEHRLLARTTTCREPSRPEAKRLECLSTGVHRQACRPIPSPRSRRRGSRWSRPGGLRLGELTELADLSVQDQLRLLMCRSSDSVRWRWGWMRRWAGESEPWATDHRAWTQSTFDHVRPCAA